MICNKCGNPAPDGALFCTVCGNPMPKKSGFCPSCGKELTPGALFCQFCGMRIPTQQQSTPKPPTPPQPKPAPEEKPYEPKQVDMGVLKRASSRRMLSGLLSLLTAVAMFFWPFTAVNADPNTAYFQSSDHKGMLLLLLIPAGIFMLINLLSGIICLSKSAKMRRKHIELTSGSRAGGSIMLIICYSLMLVVSFFTSDTYGIILFIAGIVFSGVKLGIDVKFISSNKQMLWDIEDNYRAAHNLPKRED